MHRRLALTFLVVAACGSHGDHASGGDAPSGSDAALAGDATAGDAPSDAATGDVSSARSGSRLKLYRTVTPDGLRIPTPGRVTFYDSTLGLNCDATVHADDGNTYCTPTAYQPVYFSDAACTVPFIVPDGTSPLYFAQAGAAGRFDVYTEGAAATHLEWSFDGTSCVQVTNVAGHAVTATGFDGVGPTTSTLVQMTTTYVGSGALQLESYATSDGVVFPLPGAYDTTLAQPCAIEYTYSGSAAACFPKIGSVDFYVDSHCADPEIEVAHGSAAPPYAMYDSVCEDDPIDTRLFSVGAAGSYAAYQSAAGRCIDTAQAPQGSDWYAVGAQIATVTTLTVAPAITVGARIEPILATAPDFSFYQGYDDDPVMGTRCAFADPFVAGTTVTCFPIAEKTTVLYADTVCTMPVDVLVVLDFAATCADPLAPVPAYAYKTQYSDIRAVGAQITTKLYTIDGPDCVLYPPEGETFPYRAFAVSASSVPSTSWATGTVMIDP